MADSLEFQLRLIDKMSAPARQAARAVGDLERKLKATSKSGSALDKAQAGPEDPKKMARAKAAEEKAAARALAKQQATEQKALALAEKSAAKAVAKQQAADAKSAALAEKKALQAVAKSRALDEKRLAQAMRSEDKREKMLMASERRAYALADKFKKQQAANEARAARAAEKATKDRMRALKDAADIGGLQGPELMFERMGKALEVLKTPMGATILGIGAIAAAAVVATVAVVAFTAGLVALGVAGAKLALAAAGARKDLEITLEAMLGSQEAAARTVDGINKITNEVAITSEKASALVKSLSAAGLKNESVLLGTVKAIGQAESVVEGAGAKLEAIIQRSQTPKAWLTPMGVQLRKVFQISPEDLQGTGIGIQAFYDELGARIGKGTAETRFALAFGRISAEEGTKALNAVVEKKLGAAAAKKMLQLDNQLIRFKQNVSKLFEGVKVEGFLKVLKAVLDIFDQSTISGIALKTMLEGTFNGLFTAVERVAPYVKIFMKGLIILALQVYIGFKPLLKRLGMIGEEGKGSQEELIERMSKLGEKAGKLARNVSDAVEKIIWLNEQVPIAKASWEVLKSAFSFNPFEAVGDAARGLGRVIGEWLVEAVPRWVDAGKDLVRGLANGVVRAGTELVSAVTSLGEQALQAFRKKFDMHSPSRVTMGFGQNISIGLAQGIKSKANVATDTMAKVIPIAPFMRRPQAAYPPPRAVAPAAQAGGSGGRGNRSSGGITLHVEKDGIHIHLEGATTAEEVRSMFPEMMADALEKFAETQGVDKETNGAAA